MPEHVTTRSQDLPPRFHDSGLFYWVKTDRFLEKKALYTNNSGSIILSEKEVQDIDTTEDWQIAEMKYQLIHKPVA
jgi:N-acylneuraminate cytidylyltransferase